MKKIKRFLTLLVFASFLLSLFFQLEHLLPIIYSLEKRYQPFDSSLIEIKQFPKLAHPDGNYSYYNLSVKFDDYSSSVEGNLSVNFYNNDPVNFTMLPFHIYLSGMAYDKRRGNIEILNVTKVDDPNTALGFNVSSEDQLMWVDLDTTLEPFQRAFFLISFNATLPDGGFDRANSHGEDINQSRIYKFTGFYPMPCVYDEFDGWNVDPYLYVGDPFYFDMAYYDLILEVPTAFIVAATGKLIEKKENGLTTLYHFNPIYPVRETTFSTSKYFEVESAMVNGINVSTFYLNASQLGWKTNALLYAKQAVLLFNETFGIYPYPTFNVVEEYSPYYGMEYPNQVYIAQLIDDLEYRDIALESTIVHETAHQWWYNLVGNDEVDLGFLDEGLTCWSANYYAETYYSDWNFFFLGRYIDLVRLYFAENGLPSKINQSNYECYDPNANCVFISYRKTPLILEKLRRTIGSTNFISGLKLFFGRNQFKIALLSDLQQSFEDVIGASLDWFFLPWFDNSYLPNYKFTNVGYDSIQGMILITVEDLNEPLNNYIYSQQIPLNVFDAVGQIVLNENVWINGTTVLSIPSSINPNVVSLIYNDDVLVQLSSLDIDSLTIEVGMVFIQNIVLIITISIISATLAGLAIFLFLRKRRKE